MKFLRKFFVAFDSMFLLLSLFSHAMEMLPLLEKSSQQQVCIYFEKTLPNLNLLNIGKHYHRLPMNCRGKVICNMPSEVLRLHRVALWLPGDIQNKIFDYIKHVMFEGNKEGTELFYDMSIVEVLQLYREKQFKALLDKTDKPLKDIVLKVSDSSYFCSPIISIEEQRQLNSLNNKEIKQYIQGKTVLVWPDGDKNHKCTLESCIRCCWVGGVGIGVEIGASSLIATLYYGGVGCLLKPIFYGSMLGANAGCCAMIYLAKPCYGLCKKCCKMQKVTL